MLCWIEFPIFLMKEWSAGTSGIFPFAGIESFSDWLHYKYFFRRGQDVFFGFVDSVRVWEFVELLRLHFDWIIVLP